MNRNSLVLTATIVLLGTSVSWLLTRNHTLKQELLAGKADCEEQIERLETNFRAEINTLQRDIMTR